MKIGEFSKASGLPVSVLRYYDECGLLSPVFTDRFTGYRYYKREQLAVCCCISELKAVGFTLSEIKKFFTSDSGKREQMFLQKREALTETLKRLEALQEEMTGVDFMKISDEVILKENIDIPFENDEEVIGKWEIVGILDEYSALGGEKRELYFLPGGEWYWCFGWTKGKLLYSNGAFSSVNDYTLEHRGGELYMTIALKSYDYPKSGKTETVTLRRVDQERYTSEGISRKDRIDFPFVNDERVLGRWVVFGFIHSKDGFDPNEPGGIRDLYFKEIEFLENGSCTSVYGSEIIRGDDKQVWTKGYVLRKWNSTACAYEIRRSGEKEYLIIEWKSGDYRWGGCDTNYYVFVRG